MNEPSSAANSHETHDVRMRGFSKRATVEHASRQIDDLAKPLATESVPLERAVGRTLAETITSEYDVPGFDRAMMDGFAVLASDTEGASTYNPLKLTIVGQALPGSAFDNKIMPGQAIRIMTGAPIPSGADAVVPAERTETDGDHLLVAYSVPAQKHVGPRGEDIRAGDTILTAGRRLRAQDVGVLSSIGVASTAVVRTPRVRIAITGNELLPTGTPPNGFRITDSNGLMLEALVNRDGGCVVTREIVPDDPNAILSTMQADADVVLVSGGSSVGVEDYAPGLLSRHGQLVFHGVAMRPSSPSGMGIVNEHLVFLLPGNPVSCLCSYDFFAGRGIRQLAGRSADWPYRSVRLPLKRKIVSQIGRVDYARVRIENGQADPIAIAGASLLSSTTRADGFVVIPEDREGYPPETKVNVFRYE